MYAEQPWSGHYDVQSPVSTPLLLLSLLSIYSLPLPPSPSPPPPSSPLIDPNNIWVSAHTTQFTKPGWIYLAHGSGTGIYLLSVRERKKVEEGEKKRRIIEARDLRSLPKEPYLASDLGGKKVMEREEERERGLGNNTLLNY
jgi:hypothetical protein